MRVALAAVGFTSTIAQILLMRELVATFYGNELLFGLVLAAWLAWVAIGSWGLARLPPLCPPRLREGGKGGQRTFAAGLVLAALLLPAQITLVRAARTLLGVTPGAFVEFGPMVGTVIFILAPLCLLSGFLFTLGARLTVERGSTAGRAYVWESAGAVVGGALFSFALIRWLDPFQTAFLVSAVNLTVALRLLKPVTWNLKLSLVSFLFLALTALPLGRYLHTATLHWQWSDASTGSAYHLAFTADSPYGRLTVQARDGQRVFYENGLLAFETQGTFPEEVAHFPLLMHPDPRDVLLVGGGVGGDLREILKHPVARATYVELDPLLIQAAQAHLPPEDAAVLNDPRVTLILTDGRLYVKMARRSFDIVILDLPEPATGALNRFYTREFFEEVRAVLNPGGVFALGLPSAENYWSPELARRNGSVYHTLRAVFPQVVVLPGEHNFFLASDAPLETDPATLAGRLAGRSVETRWVTPGYIEYVFTTDRFAEVRWELEAMAGVRLNRDLAPICYYYDLALWLSRFYPDLRGPFENASLVNLWWVAVPLVLVVLLMRWRRGAAIPFAIAAIGLAEMTLEVVILFAFQVLRGTLYAQVSLIVTAFMAGLALGGAASNRVLPSPSSPSVRGGEAGIKWMLIGVQAAVAVYSGLFPLIISLPIPAPALAFPLLALAAGGLTGMAFPLAVALVQPSTPSLRGWAGGRGTGRVVGLLYGADLVGGCLGALLGAVFFVPVVGIPQTCMAVALVGLAGLLALV
ncbi:MAG: methyltransferase domain-containing protein [Anaerolineae bacterium]